MQNSTQPFRICQNISEYLPSQSFVTATTQAVDSLSIDLPSASSVDLPQTVDDRGSREGGSTPISYPPQVANFGFDTLDINFHVEFLNRFELFPALEEAKHLLQSGSDQEVHFHMGKSEIFSFNLQRNGTKRFMYVLKSGDVTVSLSDRDHTSTVPNMNLKVGSMSSQENLSLLVIQFKNWMNYLGVKFHNEKVSRFDVCSDIRCKIADTNIEIIDRQISRCQKHGTYHSHKKLTGVQVGAGSIVLRVYDKIAEMKQSKDLEKQLFFKQLWGKDEEDITRVEFQLRREAIKQIFPESSTFEDIRKGIGNIWAYLTREWFRLADSPVDRDNKHQSRSKISEWWKIVQRASVEVVSSVRKRGQLHINIPALKRQIRGCMVSIIAAVGHASDDFFGIMGTCRDVLESEISQHIDDLAFKEKLKIKRTAAIVSF